MRLTKPSLMSVALAISRCVRALPPLSRSQRATRVLDDAGELTAWGVRAERGDARNPHRQSGHAWPGHATLVTWLDVLLRARPLAGCVRAARA
jgi:hypothetical protein